MFEAPVLIITGFPLLAIFFIKGRLLMSADAILKYFKKGFKKSTDFSSKGVEEKSILFFCRNEIIFCSVLY